MTRPAWIQREAPPAAPQAWRTALVLAGLLAASLVYGEVGGRTGAQVALAVFLVVLAVAWPGRDRGRLVPRRRRGPGQREAEPRRVRATREAAAARAAALVTDPGADPGQHVVFYELGGRYRLLARAGPAPSPGAPVEPADAVALVVAKVARSPLPGDTRQCAFLGRSTRPEDRQTG